MLFFQLAGTDSLREICNGLAACLGKLVHLGVGKAPNKSILSYANRNRPAELFKDLFWAALDRFRANGQFGAKKHKFRFKNKLLSLDSTTISLCLSLFPWAKFRRAKGGVKAHVLLDHADYMPSFVHLSKAKLHDARLLAMLSLSLLRKAREDCHAATCLAADADASLWTVGFHAKQAVEKAVKAALMRR